MLMIQGIIRSLAQTGFFAVILFIFAGTWHWPRAIQFLVVFGLLSLFSTVGLAQLAPASLVSRVSPLPSRPPIVARELSGRAGTATRLHSRRCADLRRGENAPRDIARIRGIHERGPLPAGPSCVVRQLGGKYDL